MEVRANKISTQYYPCPSTPSSSSTLFRYQPSTSSSSGLDASVHQVVVPKPKKPLIPEKPILEPPRNHNFDHDVGVTQSYSGTISSSSKTSHSTTRRSSVLSPKASGPNSLPNTTTLIPTNEGGARLTRQPSRTRELQLDSINELYTFVAQLLSSREGHSRGVVFPFSATLPGSHHHPPVPHCSRSSKQQQQLQQQQLLLQQQQQNRIRTLPSSSRNFYQPTYAATQQPNSSFTAPNTLSKSTSAQQQQPSNYKGGAQPQQYYSGTGGTLSSSSGMVTSTGRNNSGANPSSAFYSVASGSGGSEPNQYQQKSQQAQIIYQNPSQLQFAAPTSSQNTDNYGVNLRNQSSATNYSSIQKFAPTTTAATSAAGPTNPISFSSNNYGVMYNQSSASPGYYGGANTGAKVVAKPAHNVTKSVPTSSMVLATSQPTSKPQQQPSSQQQIVPIYAQPNRSNRSKFQQQYQQQYYQYQQQQLELQYRQQKQLQQRQVVALPGDQIADNYYQTASLVGHEDPLSRPVSNMSTKSSSEQFYTYPYQKKVSQQQQLEQHETISGGSSSSVFKPVDWVTLVHWARRVVRAREKENYVDTDCSHGAHAIHGLTRHEHLHTWPHVQPQECNVLFLAKVMQRVRGISIHLTSYSYVGSGNCFLLVT